MILRIALVFLGIGILGFTPSAALGFGGSPQTPPPPPPLPTGPEHGNFVLRVMTYNVQGLPLPGTDHSRYADIGRILKERRTRGEAPQLVAIQEAFVDDTEKLALESGYPYVARGKKGAFLQLGSGLMLLSEFPIMGVERMVYDKCISWDCFSRKGAMRARVHLDGVPFEVDVYNTHMNSDPDSDRSVTIEQTREVRAFQMRQYQDFLASTRAPDSLVIAPGDYNLPQDDPGFTEFFSLMSFLADGGVSCFFSRSCTGGGISAAEYRASWDHIIYSPTSGRGNLTAQAAHFSAEFTQAYNGRMLSDHVGLEAHYFLSW